MTKRAMAAVVGVLLALGLLLLLAGLPNAAMVDADSGGTIVDDIQISIGILPADMIRGHLQAHTESTMHGGPPAVSDEFHVVVALFDAKSGTRIADADVTALVAEVGYAGEQKRLDPMPIAGADTYGNYFTMHGPGLFHINLAIHVPGRPQEIDAEFEHRHR